MYLFHTVPVGCFLQFKLWINILGFCYKVCLSCFKPLLAPIFSTFHLYMIQNSTYTQIIHIRLFEVLRYPPLPFLVPCLVRLPNIWTDKLHFVHATQLAHSHETAASYPVCIAKRDEGFFPTYVTLRFGALKQPSCRVRSSVWVKAAGVMLFLFPSHSLNFCANHLVVLDPSYYPSSLFFPPYLSVLRCLFLFS